MWICDIEREWYTSHMQRKAAFFPVFFIFLLLTGTFIILAQKGALAGVIGVVEQATVPLQRITFGLFHDSSMSSEDKLREENRQLLTLLAKQKELEKENRALHDQFAASSPSPQNLLPTRIIGMSDDQIIIDRGSVDRVLVGSIVVYQDNLVGKTVSVSKHLSIVHLVTHPETSFTAQTSKTQTLGVVRGRGGEVLFGNVTLSDKLEKGDVVVTKDDVDEHGQGYPPGLVVGKILSVNKQPSALFQAAEVKSLVNFDKLSTVFVMTEQK